MLLLLAKIDAVCPQCIFGVYSVYIRCMLGVYSVYTRCIFGVYSVYTRCIFGVMCIWAKWQVRDTLAKTQKRRVGAVGSFHLILLEPFFEFNLRHMAKVGVRHLGRDGEKAFTSSFWNHAVASDSTRRMSAARSARMRRGT